MTQNQLKKHAGTLQLSMNCDSSSLLFVHRDTPLEEVMLRLTDQHYVLATDNGGRITGIISSQQIAERLESANPYECKRWQQMPLSALQNVAFSQKHPVSSAVAHDIQQCVAITEGDHLFGLAVEDDIFLSWQRLESLLSMALSDPLTGLLNRLAYERRLHEEWSRAIRTKTSIAVIVVDVDRFKHINDSYGHATGDVVLRGVGHELEASLRSYDVVARFGGDEFVALCLGCSAGDLTIPIERVQQGVNGMNFEAEGQSIPVSISVGAAIRHDGFDSSSPRDLFTAADECLYHAKASADTAWKVELGSGCSRIPEPVRHSSQDNTTTKFETVNH